jgi:hypothetical protein
MDAKGEQQRDTRVPKTAGTPADLHISWNKRVKFLGSIGVPMDVARAAAADLAVTAVFPAADRWEVTMSGQRLVRPSDDQDGAG